MDMITQGNIVRTLKTSALAFVLVFSAGGVFPVVAHAQYSGDANCCGSDVYDMYVSPQAPTQPPQQDIYDLYVSPKAPTTQPPQQDIYDLYVSPKAPTTPGTVTIESVPTYTTYDVYAQTPYYASTPYYGYGGMGSASLGIGLGFGVTTPFYPTASFYPTSTFYPTQSFAASTPSNNYTSTYSPTTVSNPTTTYSPTSVYAPAPVNTYSPTSVYSPTSTYAPTNTSTYAPTNTSVYSPSTIYSPSDSHNSVYSPSTVTTDSHNYTGPVTISVVSNTAQAAPQYPVQYVAPAPTYYSGGSTYYPPQMAQAPSCSITASASPAYFNYGSRAVTLTWSSSFANSGYITPLVGTVAPSGSTTVFPNASTLYTLTVSGNGGTSSCQTYAGANYVAPAVYSAPVAYQAAAVAPYVALTQIPYTGFDFGPFGNAIYWTLLALFAVAVSYLALYYRGGAFALIASMVRGKTNAERTPNVAERTQKNPIAASVLETKAAKVESSRGDTSQSRGVTSGSGTKDAMLSVGETEGGIGPRIVVLRS